MRKGETPLKRFSFSHNAAATAALSNILERVITQVDN